MKKIGLYQTISVLVLGVIGFLYQNFTSIESVSSATSSQPSDIREIVFKIDPSYLDNQSLSEIKTNIAGYVDDLNSILVNNQINTKLFFNPDHLEVKKYFGTPIGGSIQLKSDWKYALYVWPQGQEGGGTSFLEDTDRNQLSFFARMKIKFISRNDLNINLSVRREYYRFLEVVTHELGHKFNLGLSEYYSLYENKPVEMLLGISQYSHPEDPFFLKSSNYWSARQNMVTDVMKGSQVYSNIKNPLINIKFSSFSRNLANMYLSGQISNLDKPVLPVGVKYLQENSHPYNKIAFDNMNIVVKVKDASGMAIRQCKVTSYKLSKDKKGVVEISTSSTDSQGQVTFIGKEADLKYGNNSNIIYFKADCDGYKIEIDAISIFDLQAYAFLNGGDQGDFHFNGTINFKVTKNENCLTKDTKKIILNGQSIETFSQRIAPQTCADVKKIFTCSNGSFGPTYNLNYFDSCQDSDYVSKELVFYVDRSFLSQQSESSIVNNLRNYTRELEKIYLNTSLRFVFKPENVKFFDQPLVGQSITTKYIGADYKFAVQITKVNKPTKILTALDVDNDSNLLWIANANFMNIYSSEQLTANSPGISSAQLLANQQRFKEQIRMFQLAVGFRLGLADYDNLAVFNDTTNVLPNLSTGPLVNNLSSNLYWKNRTSVVPGYTLNSQSILLVNSRLSYLKVNDSFFVNPTERSFINIKNNFDITHKILAYNNAGISGCDVDLYNQAGQLIDSQKTNTSGSFTFSYVKYISQLDGDIWPFSNGKKSFLMVKARCAGLKPCGELISSQDILFQSNNILQNSFNFGFFGDKGRFKCVK